MIASGGASGSIKRANVSNRNDGIVSSETVYVLKCFMQLHVCLLCAADTSLLQAN